MRAYLDKVLKKIKNFVKKVRAMVSSCIKQKSRTEESPSPSGKTHTCIENLGKWIGQQKKCVRWSVIAAAVVVLLLMIVLLFRGCAGGDVLQGTWSLDGTTVYQFEGNGEGAMILPSRTYTFKYTINKEDQTVSIDFEDEKASDKTYSYQVSADKLILAGTAGGNPRFEFSKMDQK